MVIKVKLPKLSETTDVLVIEEVLVAPGDAVTAHQALFLVETDKVTVEVPSPMSGEVVEVIVGEGDEIRTGDILCVISA